MLFDALYDPWPTPLAAAARDAGCRIVSGLDLLLAQAVGQFEQFTGVTRPGRRDARRASRGARIGPDYGLIRDLGLARTSRGGATLAARSSGVFDDPLWARTTSVP